MSIPVIIVSAVFALLTIVIILILYKKRMKKNRQTMTPKQFEPTKQKVSSKTTTSPNRTASKATSRLSVKKAIPILVYRIITSGGSDERSMVSTPAFKMLLNKLGVNWNESKKFIESPNIYNCLKGIDEAKIFDAVILIPRVIYEITGNDRVKFDKLTLAYLNEFEKIGYTEYKLREMISDFDTKSAKTPNRIVSKNEIKKKGVKKTKASPAPDLPFKEYAIPILLYKIGEKGGFDEDCLKDTNSFCEILLDAGVFWDQCKPYIDAPNLYGILASVSQIDISVDMIFALKMIGELVEKDPTKEDVLIEAYYEEFGKLGFSKEKIDVMVWTTMNMTGDS